ncbi:MAG: alkaline phosphatase family protein [Salibacteraceae bacterium]|nr:alkaline phosphatase family protein [Salibacteraceae bacterium]
MNRSTLLLILGSFIAFAQHANAQAKPKLVVGIIVDQMRTDYIYRYWDHYSENGFKRLAREGYFCKNAHFGYIPTYTGPGHASVYTGTSPMVHGIIANDWYDKNLKQEVYCASDESQTAVGIDKNEAAGQMSPSRMMAPSLGDAIRISNIFKGKSIGVSLKDRGAILPAGHSANAAYWLDYKTGKMISSSYYMQDLPKWVTQFNKEKNADALCKEPWTPMLALEYYTQSTEDNTPYEAALDGSGNPTFPYDMAAAVKSKGYYAFAKSPYGNTFLRKFAEQALINEDLGDDEFTDLLAISFSSTDIIGHSYGPQSIEIEDTYLRLDLEIEQLLEALDQRVGAGNYVLFLTADHAGAQVPQYLKDHQIPADYFETKAFVEGLKNAFSTAFGVENLMESYSNQQVFYNHDLMREKNISRQSMDETLIRFAMRFKGVSNVLTTEQLQHPLPQDNFSKLAQNGWNPLRSGDAAIQYLPGWMSYSHQGTTHGSSYAYDTHVPLFFFGFGVNQGVELNEVDITQIAPTISIISSIAFPDASNHQPIVGAIK